MQLLRDYPFKSKLFIETFEYSENIAEDVQNH